MIITKDDLFETGLSPNELYVLECIYSGNVKDVAMFFGKEEFHRTLNTLENKGYLERTSESKVTLTSKTLKRYGTSEEDIFIRKYRQLFKDTGVLGGMGDKIGCAKKMKDFMKKYPEYTHDIILDATKMYLERESRNNNYKYMQKAHYFIEKDKVSNLATFCEIVFEGHSEEDNFTTKA